MSPSQLEPRAHESVVRHSGLCETEINSGMEGDWDNGITAWIAGGLQVRYCGGLPSDVVAQIFYAPIAVVALGLARAEVFAHLRRRIADDSDGFLDLFRSFVQRARPVVQLVGIIDVNAFSVLPSTLRFPVRHLGSPEDLLTKETSAAVALFRIGHSLESDISDTVIEWEAV